MVKRPTKLIVSVSTEHTALNETAVAEPTSKTASPAKKLKPSRNQSIESEDDPTELSEKATSKTASKKLKPAKKPKPSRNQRIDPEDDLTELLEEAFEPSTTDHTALHETAPAPATKPSTHMNAPARTPVDVFKAKFAQTGPLGADGCRRLRLLLLQREYTHADGEGQSSLSLVVDDARFTQAMKDDRKILGMKKYDKENRVWKEFLPGKTNALTSCQMVNSDGSPYRYHVLTVTLARTYKNDIDQILSELNVVLRPHKYVLFITPDDRALIPVELFFKSLPSGMVRSDGRHDIFLQELLDIGEIGLEMVHDIDNRAFLQTIIPIDVQDYVAGVRIILASQGVKNVTVQVVVP
jgi:hypothetical protein